MGLLELDYASAVFFFSVRDELQSIHGCILRLDDFIQPCIIFRGQKAFIKFSGRFL